MANTFKCSTALLALVVAALLPLVCFDWTTQAQKTIKNSYQQSFQQQNTGSNPQSVYGSYDQQRQTSSSFVAPVQQQRRVQSFRQSSSSSSSRQQQPVYQQQESNYESSSSSLSQQAEADAEPAQYGAVAGQPGVDFPAYTRVPKTSFSCEGLPYDYGMYADEETGCQAYHMCYNGRKESFLCGVGTVFNQRILHCDYWYSVDCGKSSQYYSSNAYMGSSQPEPGPAEANAPVARPQQVAQQSSYSRTQVSRVNRPSSSYQQSGSSFSRNTQQVQEAY